ncbi:hypothetical protein ABG768_001040 [Culter alburnus]|uniref:Uncharacterized protein n=1 Tax=Culter alburnus TaxID=194366 RepID=A0AAW2B6B6_CULAL
MIARCDPENGDFGFRRFYNADDLLPRTNLPYYEVGNLNTTGPLPEYVTEDYTGYLDDSNTDRIIVLFKSSWSTPRFDRIYVTRHSDQTNFDWNHTYCISSDLFPSAAQSVKSELSQSQRSHLSTEDDTCSKCCKRLMMLLFIFAVFFLLLKLKI